MWCLLVTTCDRDRGIILEDVHQHICIKCTLGGEFRVMDGDTYCFSDNLARIEEIEGRG